MTLINCIAASDSISYLAQFGADEIAFVGQSVTGHRICDDSIQHQLFTKERKIVMVLAQLSKDVLLCYVLRLKLNVETVSACDLQEVEFFSNERDDEAKIKPVQLSDADTSFCKSINKDPERIDLMDLDAVIVVILSFMLYRDIEELFIMYS